MSKVEEHAVEAVSEHVTSLPEKPAVGEDVQAKEVHSAELFAAIKETPLPRWSKASIRLYCFIAVCFCCSCANGYDGSLMSSIVAMPAFKNKFDSGLTGQRVSLLNALYSIGSIAAFPFAPFVSDRFGRRVGMFCGGVIIIVGAILTSTANTVGQFITGRFVLGAGIMFMTVAAPAYAVEIAPPHWRGRAVGFYNCGWFGGSIPAAFVTYGCQYINSDYSWRVPLILQCTTCLIVIVSVFFMPESPRHLMAKDENEKAIEILATYHGNGDRHAPLVMLEVEEIKENLRQDALYNKAIWDWRPLFSTHNSRWRIAQTVMMGVFGQFSGNGLGYYNTSIYDLLGYTSSFQQLGFTVVNQVVSATGALTAMSLTDRMPRRKVLVYGTFVTACMLMINAALQNALAKATVGTVITNTSLAQGALAFFFLFNMAYSFAYTPLQGVIPAEALDTRLRARGLAMYGLVVNVFGFINLYASPIALGNIKYNYVWVFVGWDFVETALWYFFCVESQGRSLEELEWVYNQPNPVKASLKVDKVLVRSNGVVTEKVVDA
ncbi:MFS lactose permease, putative [Talaromyces stipitatus ATCC 10500]|uniref:MFS lactose permease, putative n=1 Tax=Talaromyces stipitatus (strain ATCC 10500 / CBS 375.48 / QM 6759 / NRRL 1006) TaxID=441959 RepID=B8M4C1_TALSN|nr:MFS lactose permease, putative [Talaromyces stipitatus ATCC 10500]EED19116.1 MFS lactose permease, putative [Talaromyces stipitatus ATCC 10500]